MVNHFERVFTWLSDAKWCFSHAVVWVFTILRNNFFRFLKLEQVLENACAGSLAGWLAGWQAGQRWLAGWLSWLCEVHFGWVFTRLSDANLLTVWLAAWLTAWLAEFCDMFVWLFNFERVFTWLSDADLCFSPAVYLISLGKIAALAGWLAAGT